MIELSEEDIKVVARARFFEKHKQLFWGFMAGFIVVTVGTMLGLSFLKSPPVVVIGVGVVLMAIYVVSAISWGKSQDKAVTALVEEWSGTKVDCPGTISSQ